mgnify:CR=1 FL=1
MTFSRMGAFRFKELKDGGFINVSELLKIPTSGGYKGV